MSTLTNKRGSTLFDRIDTGSKVANKAEVRRGALVGPFLDLVIELSSRRSFLTTRTSDRGQKSNPRGRGVGNSIFCIRGRIGMATTITVFAISVAYAKKMNEAFINNPLLIEQYQHRFTDTMAYYRDYCRTGFERRDRNSDPASSL